jgi:hypothetical protein
MEQRLKTGGRHNRLGRMQPMEKKVGVRRQIWTNGDSQFSKKPFYQPFELDRRTSESISNGSNVRDGLPPDVEFQESEFLLSKIHFE